LIARSARGDVRWDAAVFDGTGGTEKRCSAISSYRSAARTSLYLIARSARGDVRWDAAVFDGELAERKSAVPPSPPAERRREHRCI
jgi:hypothetical protein